MHGSTKLKFILLTFFFSLSGKGENERCIFVKYLSGYNLFVHTVSSVNVAPFVLRHMPSHC